MLNNTIAAQTIASVFTANNATYNHAAFDNTTGALANLATAEGQTVEPLPFRGMRSYPPADDDQPETSPAREAWLRDDQTRRQDEAFWRAIRRWSVDGDRLGRDREGGPGGERDTRRSER